MRYGERSLDRARSAHESCSVNTTLKESKSCPAHLKARSRSSPAPQKVSVQRSRGNSAPQARVIVNYATDKVGAEEVVKFINDAGSRVVAIQADIGSPVDVENLYRGVDEAFGGQLNTVINNAGVP